MKRTGPGGGRIFEGPHWLLPTDKARHVGEAVAMVVAETRDEALDAAEALDVEYEELPWVIHSERALEKGAPRAWNEAPGNVIVDTHFGDREATDRAFAEAGHVVKMKFHIARCTAVAIEPRAALASYDAGTGRYTLYAGGGGAVRYKKDLASLLGIEPRNLRVVCRDVGGNFGSKNRVYVEYGLALWASRKLVRPDAMPYRNAVGMTYDSGTYEANMDLAMRIADWNGFEARRKSAAARGRLLGRGLSNYVESSIGSPQERTEFSITPAGRVKVVIGTQPSGQGHETRFAQVVSWLLSVPVEAIDILLGDTDVVSIGGGSHSGRSMRHAATVFTLAAKELIEKGKKIAAHMLEAGAAEVQFADGRFSAPHALRAYGFLELARDSAEALLPRELSGGLAVVADNEMHDPVFPNGCAICECEVDPETGAVDVTRFTAVDDVGRCINPLIVHGQTHGGAAQGIGQAISE